MSSLPTAELLQTFVRELRRLVTVIDEHGSRDADEEIDYHISRAIVQCGVLLDFLRWGLAQETDDRGRIGLQRLIADSSDIRERLSIFRSAARSGTLTPVGLQLTKGAIREAADRWDELLQLTHTGVQLKNAWSFLEARSAREEADRVRTEVKEEAQSYNEWLGEPVRADDKALAELRAREAEVERELAEPERQIPSLSTEDEGRTGLEAERVIRKSEVNLKPEGPTVRGARRSLLVRIADRIADWLRPPLASAPTKIEEPFSVVPVFFATDRRMSEASTPQHAIFLDGRGGDKLIYGVAEVSIPPNHRIGKLERPLKIFSFELRQDSERHIVIAKCEVRTEADWNRAASDRLAHFGGGAALVFIHGYNVLFDDAIRRAGQIGRDLRFEGVVAAYSWASEAAIKGYLADDDNIKLTVPLLREFLRNLRASGATTIHVIAHSMGNRALLDVLHGMVFAESDRFIGEAILAAPDLDAKVFEKAIAELKGKARRYTLYGSAADAAMKASKVARGYPRAGDGGEDIVVVDGVETIDATAVGEDLLGLGHSYFADKRLVLDDIFYVIREALPAAKRAGLTPQTKGRLKYWIFEPS